MKKGLMGMNDRMIRHYFVDSNSSQGYADLSEASLGSLEQLIRLKYFPLFPPMRLKRGLR